MKKIAPFILFILCAHFTTAQSIKTFEDLIRQYPLGSHPNGHKLQRITDPPLLFYDVMYSIEPINSQTLYGRPIHSIALGVKADSIAAISIYVAFDTTLHKEMEHDLGVPEFGWMGFAPGTNTTGIVWTRYWDLPNYSVSLKCTRYQYQLEAARHDLIAISFVPLRSK